MATKEMDKKLIRTFNLQVARFQPEAVQSVLVTEENMEAVSSWFDGQILLGPEGTRILKVMHRGGIAIARPGNFLVKTKGNVLIVFTVNEYNKTFISTNGTRAVREEN